MPRDEKPECREDNSTQAGRAETLASEDGPCDKGKPVDEDTTEAAGIVNRVFQNTRSADPKAADGYSASMDISNLGPEFKGKVPIKDVDDAAQAAELMNRHRGVVAGRRFGYAFLIAALIVLAGGLMRSWNWPLVLVLPVFFVLSVFGGLFIFGRGKAIGEIGKRLPFLKKEKRTQD